MFERALKDANQLPVSERDALIARLDRKRGVSHNLGYGVGDDMDSLLVKYVKVRPSVRRWFSTRTAALRGLAENSRPTGGGTTFPMEFRRS